MSSSNVETDALIELLVQLKKIVGTVPDQAKALVTSQPTLAYSLVKLMVSMNILNAEALQKTLAASANPLVTQPTVVAPGPSLPGLSASGPPNGHGQTTAGAPSYSVPLSYQPNLPVPHPVAPQTYSSVPTAPIVSPNAQAMLAAIPEGQRNMVLQILSYTPEQINQLAPTERATFMQLRATFGMST
ncbi:hypothetical protein M422DRAFT_25473 [Sphaerobolus stellatus SS14]|nr:hypothetical protein M422DRAFT_25473 [Sphaerobolus stellatus SS14]